MGQKSHFKPATAFALLLTTLALAVGCRGNLGESCKADQDCRKDLACLKQLCVTWEVKKAHEDKEAFAETASRVKKFIAARYRMTPEEAEGLCVAGKTVIITVDKKNNISFCLKPSSDSFEVIYFGKPLTEGQPCGGKLGENLVIGDLINKCIE
jgi:hypothetical protein